MWCSFPCSKTTFLPMWWKGIPFIRTIPGGRTLEDMSREITMCVQKASHGSNEACYTAKWIVWSWVHLILVLGKRLSMNHLVSSAPVIGVGKTIGTVWSWVHLLLLLEKQLTAILSLVALILSAPGGVGVLPERQHFCEGSRHLVLVLGNGLEWCPGEVLFYWLCVQPNSGSFL